MHLTLGSSRDTSSTLDVRQTIKQIIDYSLFRPLGFIIQRKASRDKQGNEPLQYPCGCVQPIIMEVATAPSTPNNSIPSQVMRRSFTAPTRSRRSPQPVVPIRESESETETLYAHNTTKIVSFNILTNSTPPQRSSLVQRRSSNQQDAPQDAPSGTLPWASATERTLAAGNLGNLCYRDSTPSNLLR